MQALQIGKLASLIEPAVFEKHFIDQFFAMCEDQVAHVREAMAKACYPIAKSFSADPALIKKFMAYVCAFKQSRKYTMRQTFIIMCESVIQGDSIKSGTQTTDEARQQAELIFKEHFLQSFVELQSDKIVNVRLMLSQTLA